MTSLEPRSAIHVKKDAGLSFIQRAAFSLGTFGSAGPGTLSAQLQLYFTKFLGYPATTIGVVRSIATVFDAVTDPLMGYISDHTRSRFGRRMPYIAIGSFVYAAGVIGMWFAPRGLSEGQFYLYLGIMQIVLTIGVTMSGVPYCALIPELAKEYRARTTLASWMQMGTYLGTTWGALVRRYSDWRGDEILGFREFAVYCSVVMVVCYWLVVALVKEPPAIADMEQEGPASPKEFRGLVTQHMAGLGRSLRYALTDRYFLILFLAVFIYQVGILAGLWMYTFLLEDWFGKTWSTPFAARYLRGALSPFRDAFFLYIFFAIGCGVLFLPVWNRIGRFLEKRTCLIIGVLGIGLTYGSSYFLFAPRSFPLLIVYCLMQAFFYCAAYIFPASMLADIATHNKWLKGEGNEGMFYGANSFLIKLYNAGSQLWTGFAIDHVVGYQRGEGVVQSAETLWRMRVLYAIPACVTAFFAVLVLSRYDLTRARMAQITAQLDARKDDA